MSAGGRGERMPVLFIGHGSPMNAITENRFAQGWRSVGEAIPRPKAVLSVSAHWYVPGTWLTGNPEPPTIHDFGGFPRELYKVRYPAAGDPALAEKVRLMLRRSQTEVRSDWGLDHGTWSVLKHLLPAADVPVVQLSIDRRAPAAAHLDIGRALAPLRDAGILVMGSGNLVHNLRVALGSRAAGDEATPGWAERFDTEVRAALENGRTDALLHALDSGAGRQAHPTPDHYLPVLYALGAGGDAERISFPVDGFQHTVSMRCVRFD